MADQRDSGRVPRPLFVLGAAAVGVVLALMLRALVLQVYFVPTASMAPTLRVGDRVLVEKASILWRAPAAGDVVVFDATDVWVPATDGLLVTKRVLAVAGDRIACCDAAGRLVRNGVALTEPYARGTREHRHFVVRVPAGRIWVMGDNRAESRDSASFIGTSGGGSVPVSHVLGRVVAVVWPVGHAGILGTPRTKEAHDPA